MSVTPCPECGKKPRIAVAPGGWCFAACDGCGRSTWPAPLVSGTEALQAWERLCNRPVPNEAKP